MIPRGEDGRFISYGEEVCRDCGADLNKVDRMPQSWGRLCRKCGRARERKRYREFREEMKRDVGGSCKFCGYSIIDYHHVVPIWNHDRSHLRRNKEILIPLCRACHEIWHNVKKDLDIPIM